MKNFDKRWILLAIQIIGGLISIWALFTMSTIPLIIASLTMFFLFKCIGVTVTYHRFITHRVAKMHPVVEFICTGLGFYGSGLGPVSWAGIHNDHHKYADTDRDPHNPKILGWKGIFPIFWQHSGPDNGDLRTMVRVRRNKIYSFYQDNYYILLLLPLLLLFWPKIFFFFYLIPATMSIWSQQYTIYSHDENGAFEKMSWLYAVVSGGEHYHKWHHDHPGDTSGEGWIHNIVKLLAISPK